MTTIWLGWDQVQHFVRSSLGPNSANVISRRQFGFLCLVFAMPLCASVYMCLVVTCWERADLLALVCGV